MLRRDVRGRRGVAGGEGVCRGPQTWTRLAVKVAFVGSKPGALKKPSAAKTTPTPSPGFRSENPIRRPCVTVQVHGLARCLQRHRRVVEHAVVRARPLHVHAEAGRADGARPCRRSSGSCRTRGSGGRSGSRRGRRRRGSRRGRRSGSPRARSAGDAARSIRVCVGDGDGHGLAVERAVVRARPEDADRERARSRPPVTVPANQWARRGGGRGAAGGLVSAIANPATERRHPHGE